MSRLEGGPPLFTRMYSATEGKGAILATEISPDGTMTALSYASGEVNIMSQEYQALLFKFRVYDMESGMADPVTSFSWHPDESHFHTDWKLIGASLGGSYIQWVPAMGTKYERIFLTEDNQYSTIDYNSSGSHFVTAGSRSQLEIVDDVTSQIVQVFDGIHNFHNKQIYTTKFYPKSENLLYSGSGDASVKFWDTRERQSINKIYGVQVTGDSVDMHQDCNTVVIGGSHEDEGIQIWDVRNTGAPVRSIPWGITLDDQALNLKVKSVKFLPGTELIIAGVEDDAKPAKCFNFNTGQIVHTFDEVNRTCTSIDVSYFYRQFVIGSTSGHSQMFKYDNTSIKAGLVEVTRKETDVWFQTNRQDLPTAHLERRRSKATAIIQQHVVCIQEGQEFEWPAPVQTPSLKEPSVAPEPSRRSQSQVDRDNLGTRSIVSALSHNSKPQSVVNGFSLKTGTYDVTTDPIPQELLTLRTTNKKRLQQQVNQREEEVMAEFMKKAELVQILAHAEINADSSNTSSHASSALAHNDTSKFIKQIERHLKKSERNNESSLRQSPQLYDIEQLTREIYQDDVQLQRLPIVKGQIKNVKMMLQEDLIADGAIVRNVPHSTRGQSLASHGSMSKRSLAPSVGTQNSQAVFNHKKNSNATADYYIQQYQKNMIVELPEMNDKVAENFTNFWKAPATYRKYSVQPNESQKLNSTHTSNGDLGFKSIADKRPSYLPDVGSVPSQVKERIPDSDHLAKMRVYLMNAHQNANYVKELSDGGGLIPSSVKLKLEKRRETEAELGESFADLMSRGKHDMNKNAKKQELLEEGIDEHPNYEDDESGEATDIHNYTQASLKNQTLDPNQLTGSVKQSKNRSTLNSDYKPSLQLEAFELAIKNGDLQSALDMAANDRDLVEESLQLTRYKMRSDSTLDQMKNNQFFRKYTAQYQKQLSEVLDKNFGVKLNDRLKLKDTETFNNKIIHHVKDQSEFRKMLPDVFSANYDGSQELEQLMKNNFRQVSIPANIRQQREAESNLQRMSPTRRVPSKASLPDDPLQDASYVRRLKMANYGRWFIKPNDFTNKVHLLNKELHLK